MMWGYQMVEKVVYKYRFSCFDTIPAVTASQPAMLP